MILIENTPFNLEKDLAKAYNDFMELLPEDGWALFRDADTLFLDSFYGKYMTELIEKNPQFSCITAVTNRIGSPALKYSEYSGDDIVVHRKICKEQKEKHGYTVNEIGYVPMVSTLSGMCFVLSKKAWRKIGGFRRNANNGMLGVDNNLHYDLIQKNLKVGVAPGFYLYHWYRGGNTSDVKHLIQ